MQFKATWPENVKNVRIISILRSLEKTIPSNPLIFTSGNVLQKFALFMFPRKNPTTTAAWRELKAHFQGMKSIRMTDLFNQDADRFEKFSIDHSGMLLDYSKNIIQSETIELLLKLANEVHLKEAIEAMFSGEKINETENRAVLHTILRHVGSPGHEIEGDKVSVLVNKVLSQIENFSTALISGTHKGFTGKKISDIVNIGIGGSDLGPAMVCEALTPFRKKGIDVHFVSNVDGTDISETLKKVNAETTLFIISSKTFTTQETMTNAFSARKWFLEFTSESEIRRHFVAVSTNREAVRQFGIDESNLFEFWDWVGGRYSVWSAIGLSIACSVGFENFRKFLDGAALMDEHFRDSPFDKNIPVILALIGIWYTNFFETSSEAILPYNQYLNKLVAYLQQVSMESNGKSTDRNGEKITYPTSPVIWGAPGTNSQHSFFQMIHQGTQMIPCDFIAAIESYNPLGDHQDKLVAHFLAQARALMEGKSLDEVTDEMRSKGISEPDIKKIAPYRTFEGNRPSNTILIDCLDAHSLGMLLAMYEHKVFVQGIIWNIYSFDQWGVELGKQIAEQILQVLQNKTLIKSDSSTEALISYYKTRVIK